METLLLVFRFLLDFRMGNLFPNGHFKLHRTEQRKQSIKSVSVLQRRIRRVLNRYHTSILMHFDILLRQGVLKQALKRKWYKDFSDTIRLRLHWIYIHTLQMIKQNQKWINYRIYIKRLFEKRKENINVRISLEKTVQELSTDGTRSFYTQRKPVNHKG